MSAGEQIKKCGWEVLGGVCRRRSVWWRWQSPCESWPCPAVGNSSSGPTKRLFHARSRWQGHCQKPPGESGLQRGICPWSGSRAAGKFNV